MKFPGIGVCGRVAWRAALLAGLAFGQNGALRVTEPKAAKDRTLVTTEPAISLKGTLAWSGGDMRVLWTSNRGFSDLATVTLAPDRHTVEWSSTAPIPLRPGLNQVRIRALGQPGAAEFVNVYYNMLGPVSNPPQGAAILHGQQITYEMIGGQAVYQSDMILGKTEDVAAGRIAGRLGAHRTRPRSDTIATDSATPSGLWPIVNGVVRVPYTITINPGQLPATSTNINAALTESNNQLTNVVQWVPATGGDVNLVNFNFTVGNESGSCEAVVGMQGNGVQSIGGAENCTVTTMLHEMGHALGLYHEQSRADRNNYITYSESYVDKPQHANFDIFQSEVDSGLYNYASIMEYTSFLFSKFGAETGPVIETKPAGIVLSTDLPQYTTGDLDGIQRLYGFVPAGVTVDSNPSGLQLVVDGNTCTAPCVFTNWSIGSTHTLAVPTDSNSQTLQILDQQPYIFGNWNVSSSATSTPPYAPTDTPSAGTGLNQSITIANVAGNGLTSDPITAPEYTNYLASFITVRPYNPVVSPAGAGTITVSPTPGTLILNGVSTRYFTDRTPIHPLSATPSSGYNFYVWDNVALPFLYQGQSSFYLNTNLDYLNFDTNQPVTAFFVNDVLTTVTGSTNDGQQQASGMVPGFAIGVTENGSTPPGITETVYTPRNFDQSQDGNAFAPGKSLTLCATGWNGTTCPPTATTQSPVTTNLTYAPSGWGGIQGAGAGVNSVTFTVPNSSQEEGVSYIESGRLIIGTSISSQYCPGVQVSTSPAGTNPNPNAPPGTLDAFYSDGESIMLSAAGDPGAAIFSGWSGDFGSSESPYTMTLPAQTIATANFNTPGTSSILAVTSVSPSSCPPSGTPTVTGLATNLSICGSGFTTNNQVTYVYFGPVDGTLSYRPSTFTGTTTGTVQLQAGDFATAGYYQIAVVNVGGGGCNPSAYYTFPVANQTGTPALSVTKTHTGNFTVGQQNATYTISVENTGTANTTQPVTVSEMLPSGETLVSISGGSTWTCQTTTGVTCTNSSTLSPQTSFNAITVTVNVSTSATSPQVNSVTAAGGGAQQASASNSTTIDTTVPSVVGLSQAAATTDIDNADLVVGTVTMQSSGTVAAGNVISQSPTGGTAVAGSSVNLTVSTGPSLSLITVTPTDPAIANGLTEQFTATGTYSNNSTQNLTSQVTWGSTNTNVATIATGGLATTVGTGQSTISATLGTVTGTDTLTVTAATLVSIAVTPATPSIAKGLTQQFTATGTYTDGSTKPLTSSVAWSSGTTSVATIATSGQNAGLATAAGTGSSTISAVENGVTGTATLTVTAATLVSIAVTPLNPSIASGLTQQFAATGTYTDNSTKTLTSQVAWSSGNTSAATIAASGPNIGLATAVGAGVSTISAVLSGVTGTATLTVTAAALASIAVTPLNPSIANGLTEQFTATGTYTDNSTKTLTSQVVWSSGTTSVATIATSGPNIGLATTAGTGTSTISAVLSGVTGTSILTVTPATLVSISVTANVLSLVNGTTEQFNATGNYTNGPQNLTALVDWASDNTSVATVGMIGVNLGKVTAVGAGTANISASYSGVTGAVPVSVTGLGPCDVLSSGTYTVADAQREINEALGTFPPANDLNADGIVDVVDIQIVINAVLNLGCTTQ